MRSGIEKLTRLSAICLALLCGALPASASKPVHKKAPTKHTSATTTPSHSRSSRHGKAAKKSKAVSHATPMGPERATQIQTALIKQGYLSGNPTGTWDAQSMAAMQKLQSDNGWQTKIVPDSRALIKLGLGAQAPPEN